MILRQPGETMSRILQRFSGVGYVVVAGLLITGLINVRVLTGQWWPTPLFRVCPDPADQGVAGAGHARPGAVQPLRIEDCEQRMARSSAVSLEWLLGWVRWRRSPCSAPCRR
jgi:putative copper resistance protein D